MSSSLTYNGKKIDQREDGYVNATQMCAINGKKISHWLANQETKDYINAISTVTGFPTSALVQKTKPDVNKGIGGGTWIHPKLAICLGRWVSVEFAVWCDEHIRTLLQTGSTKIKQNPKLRQEGKKARLSLTDVVKQWILDHPQMSANERKFIYINVSDALNVGLFGKKASKLREIIGCSKNDLRDHFSDAEIVAIHTIEDLAARLVMFEGLHPVRAVVKALETSHYRLGFYGSYKELAPAE
jgi:hypothetical protein